MTMVKWGRSEITVGVEESQKGHGAVTTKAKERETGHGR